MQISSSSHSGKSLEEVESSLVTFEGTVFVSEREDLRAVHDFGSAMQAESGPTLYSRVLEACSAVASHVSEIFTGAWSVKHMGELSDWVGASISLE